MAVLEEVSDRGLALPLGIGLAVAAISAGPKLMKAGRPLIKSAIKGYLYMQERSREMFAETGERMQDIYAEAKHEYDEQMQTMKAEEHEKPQAMEAEGEAPAEGAKRTPRGRKKQAEGGEQESEQK